MVDREKFYTALSQGKTDEVRRLSEEALEAGETAEAVLESGLIPAMDQVGVRFKNGEIYIPEVLIAARAMHAGLAVLKPVLARSSGTVTSAKVVLGTVKGDLHDIGKNLVGMMLEGGGFQVVDLGADVPPDRFVQEARARSAQVIGMSALLTTTMMRMKTTIESLKAAGLDERVKTVIGGAPVTEGFARQIGADGYAPDAASAVEKVRELLKKA